jgi:hypothetical protein
MSRTHSPPTPPTPPRKHIRRFACMPLQMINVPAGALARHESEKPDLGHARALGKHRCPPPHGIVLAVDCVLLAVATSKQVKVSEHMCVCVRACACAYVCVWW